MKIVITGGHHTSALPVIALFKQQGHEILWFGHKTTLSGDKNTSLEYREITALGVSFYELKAGKFYKTFNPIRLLKIPFGFFQALFLLLKLKPNVILSFGGYLAVPTVLAGSFLGIPSVTHEQTVVSGYANKLIGRFAKKILISWPQSEKYFPQEKIVLSGIPLRKEIFSIKSSSFEINSELPTIYITAGKTGSDLINDAVFHNLESLLGFANVIHQTGDYSKTHFFTRLNSRYEEIKPKVAGRYFPRKFILETEIGEAYNKADLVIARSGAHTTTEILALEKPTVLIPIPWVSHNEQNENAKILKEAGLATILDQKDLNTDLLTVVQKVISNLSNYVLKSKEIKKFLELNSAEIIVNETISAAKK